MQLHLTWTTPENNVRVNDRCEGSWRVFNDTGWVDDMLAPVPPMSHINNYTITFNFPGEVITISSGCISITPLPFWLLHPTSSLHFIPPSISRLPPLSHPSSVLHLSTAAQHHSHFILSASVSVFISRPLLLLLICAVVLYLFLSLSPPAVRWQVAVMSFILLTVLPWRP